MVPRVGRGLGTGSQVGGVGFAEAAVEWLEWVGYLVQLGHDTH
jgi:hypothetical protein